MDSYGGEEAARTKVNSLFSLTALRSDQQAIALYPQWLVQLVVFTKYLPRAVRTCAILTSPSSKDRLSKVMVGCIVPTGSAL